jgi:protein-tyrosine-phosphatase
MKKTNILFVCRYNRFRSRIAEAYFKKINKNKNIQVKGAGLIKGSPIGGEGDKIAKQKYGLNISGKPQGLSSKLLAWQNITIVVADDVPLAVFDRNKKYGKKVISWKIKDVDTKNGRTPEKVIEEIIKKVNGFVKLLGKRK